MLDEDKRCMCTVEILGEGKAIGNLEKGNVEVVLGVTSNHELDVLGGGGADGRRKRTHW